MESIAKRKTVLKRIIIAVLIPPMLFLIFTFGAIYFYLHKYGYGMKELPRTAAVYFDLSKGFTVGDNAHGTVFIGRRDYIYDEYFEKNGYYEADRGGMVGFYNRTGNYNDPIDFQILSTNDWCHWFRLYRISDGKIEDYIS